MKATTGKKVGLALLALAVVSCSVLAHERSAIFNYSGGMQKQVQGALDDGSGLGSVETRFWAVGKAAAHNSGSCSTNQQLLAMGPDSYLVWANWENFGVSGPPPEVTDRTALLYSIENGGRGQYILMSVGYDDVLGGYDFGQVTNGNVAGFPNQESPQLVPRLIVKSVRKGNSNLVVSVAWDALNDLNGFSDVATSTNLVTGVAVRYTMGYNAPASFRTTDSTLAGNGFVNFGTSGADPGMAEVSVPMPPPGLKAFLALSLLFDGAQPSVGARTFTETAFLGEAKGVDATALADSIPAFGTVSARLVQRSALRVTWTMSEESSVSSYVVFGASSAQGAFQRLSVNLPARHTGQPYQFSASATSTRFVRVDAVTTSGRVVSSTIAPVSR